MGRIAEIEKRLSEFEPEDLRVRESGVNLRVEGEWYGKVLTFADVNYWSSAMLGPMRGQATKVAVLFANAPADIRFLLDEIKRLQK